MGARSAGGVGEVGPHPHSARALQMLALCTLPSLCSRCARNARTIPARAPLQQLPCPHLQGAEDTSHCPSQHSGPSGSTPFPSSPITLPKCHSTELPSSPPLHRGAELERCWHSGPVSSCLTCLGPYCEERSERGLVDPHLPPLSPSHSLRYGTRVHVCDEFGTFSA